MAKYDSTNQAELADLMAQQRRVDKEMHDKAMADFLAKGGVIQQVANNVSGRVEGASYSAWGAPKKKKGEEPTIEVTDE
jgi:hypothetical protein